MKKSKFSTLLQLFWTFFKIGLFTFGGGYAMLSVIERETVEKRRWVTLSDIADMVTIAESTPGVIAVNSATYIGYRIGGFFGSLVATIGVVLPSFIVICGVFFAYDAFMTNKYIAAAFAGIRCCVIVLIINAFIKLFKLMDKKIICYVACLVTFGIATFTNFGVIYLIIIALVVGVIIGLIVRSKNKKPTIAPSDDNIIINAEQNNAVGEKDNKDGDVQMQNTNTQPTELSHKEDEK